MTNYWKRRNEEMRHIQQLFVTDEEYNEAIKAIYQRAEREILKEINAELMRYADRERLSMSEARLKASLMDVQAFQSQAKRYVKERNFTERANDELRAYNVKMRTNRLKLLYERLRLETIALADREDKLLQARLDEEVYAEIIRQAGILGETVPKAGSLRRRAEAIINADFKGARFSDRIWANQADLQRELEKTIERSLIRGENPREASKNLRKLVRKQVTNKRYAAERIAVTESARVQTGAQKIAFEEFGVQLVEWIAEPSACELCAKMDGKILNRKDMLDGVTIPAHPNCRCSYAAKYDRTKWEKSLEERGL